MHVGGRLAGFAYGYEEQPDGWWRARVEPALTALGQQSLLDGAFTLVELHVRPDLHGRGIGRVLLHSLLAGLPHRRVLLSTQDGENPARIFYRRQGFVEVTTVDLDGVPYLVLAAPLPLC